VPLASRHARGLHYAIRNPGPARRPIHHHNQKVRDIVIGRDGAHWNTIVNMVPQAEEWMIERFGKFHRVATPGLNVSVPFVERIAYKRSLKENTIAIHPQTAITKDNVHVQLDGAVYAKVYDAYSASYGIDNPEQAVNVLAQSAMRKEVGNLELDQLFLEREKLNAGIAHALDEASQPWGIRVYRYEIADIHVDRGTREAMEKQSNAERLRRAEVLESQGFREKMINQSEGKRQGAINQAQGEAESIRLRATAQAEEIKLLAEANAASTRMAAEATADGLRAIASAVAEPGGQDAMVQRLAERYVEELAEMAKASNMVIVPDRPNDLAGVVATAMGMYGNVKAQAQGGMRPTNTGVTGGSNVGSVPTTPKTAADWATGR
jgi:regulator of protease activity HflC (stomatin/prohibitin superfamily)